MIDAVAAALHRLAWRLYPRAFRARYGDEALQMAILQAAEARRRHVLGGVRCWCRALAQVPNAAWRVRRDSRTPLLTTPHHERNVPMFTPLVDDARHALRALWQAPLFTVVAIAILALGVGGSTAVYSILHGVILAPLPYPDPERLGVLWSWDERRDAADGSSYLNWEDWRRGTPAFADIALYYRPEFTDQTLVGVGPTRRVQVSLVTGNFFSVMGVQPALGRTFTEQEEREAAPVVVLSDAFWRQEMGADPAVVGSSLALDGVEHQILGVMPPGFRYPSADAVMWENHAHATGWPERQFSRGFDGFVAIGRLAEGATFEAARRQLDGVAARLAAAYPDTNRDMGVRLRPLLREITGSGTPRALWLLFGATVLVLLVAATNVAHLSLARGATRRREIAIRSALGAGTGRLARQQLLEAVVMAALAGAAGVGLGYLFLPALLAVAPETIPRLDSVAMDVRMLGGALVATLALGLGFGLAPALGAARCAPLECLREGGRGSSHGLHARLRGPLVVGQVSLAMVLLAGAALFMRSLALANGEDPGFELERVVVGRVDLPSDRYGEASQPAEFFARLRDRIASSPGVAGAGIIQSLFLYRFPDLTIQAEGREGESFVAPATADAVLPGFFASVGAEIIEGRAFDSRDLQPDTRSMIINETAARTYWRGESPVGKRFRWGDQEASDARYMTVIGVVRDLRRRGLDVQPVAQFFEPRMRSFGEVVVVGDDPAASIAALRAALAEIDALVPLSHVRIGADWARTSLAARRFQSLLLGAFAALATALAAAGLFGLLHAAVTRRRREMGIRLALGAAPAALVRRVIAEAFGLVAGGILIGLAGAYALSSLVGSLLYRVAPTDPRTLAVVAGLLLGIGVLAALGPALRLVRIEPVETLTES